MLARLCSLLCGVVLVFASFGAYAIQYQVSSQAGAVWAGSPTAACDSAAAARYAASPQFGVVVMMGADVSHCWLQWPGIAPGANDFGMWSQAGACTGLPGCPVVTSGPGSNSTHDGCVASVESFYSIVWPGSTTSPSSVDIGGCGFSPSISMRSSDGSSLVGLATSSGSLFSGAAAAGAAQGATTSGVRVVNNPDGSVTTSTTVMVSDGAGGTMTQITASTVPSGGGTPSVTVTSGTGAGAPGGSASAAAAAAAAALAAANAATAAAAAQAAAAVASGNANAIAAAAAASSQAAAALAAANAQSTAANASAITAAANAASALAAANAASAAAAAQSAAAIASGNANAIAAASAAASQASAALSAANAQSTAANAAAVIAGANAAAALAAVNAASAAATVAAGIAAADMAALKAGQCGGTGQPACRIDELGTPTSGSAASAGAAGKASLNSLVPESFGLSPYVHGSGFSAWSGLPIIGGSDGCENPTAFSDYRIMGQSVNMDVCRYWGPFKGWLAWFLWAGTAVFCYRRVTRVLGGA